MSRKTQRWQAIIRVFSEGSTVWMSQNIKVNAIVTWEKAHLSTVGIWLLWLSKFGSVRKHFHLQQNDTKTKAKHFNWQWVVFFHVKLFSAILCIFCYNLFQSTLDLSFRGKNHSNVYIFPKALLCTFSAKSWKMAYFLVFKHILYNSDALPGNFSLYAFAQT